MATPGDQYQLFLYQRCFGIMFREMQFFNIDWGHGLVPSGNPALHGPVLAKHHTVNHFITMTSQWARWRLKSPASRLFTQTFIQGADQRKHQSSASLAFVREILRSPVNSPHNGPVRPKIFLVDYAIMRDSINFLEPSITLSYVVSGWRHHDLDTLSALLARCAGIFYH